MNYEENLDSFLINLCNLNDIPATQVRSTERLETPFVEVLFELGAANGHIGPDGLHDMFNTVISFSVFTDRDRNAAKHNELVVKIRQMVLEDFCDGLTAFIPAYCAHELTPEGSNYDIIDDLDVTELRFSFMFHT